MERKTVSVLLVLVLLASAILFAVEPVYGQAGTQISGTLTADATWTPQGSPYTFVGENFTVASGVTLTITPGTLVDLKLASFIIEGTLRAIGDDANRIVIQAEQRLTRSWPPRIYFAPSSTPWDEATGTGCIIDHAEIHISNFQYETVMGDYPKISNNICYNYGSDAAAIRTEGLVINNTILGGYVGILGQFNVTILSNIVKDADIGILCGYMSFDPIYHPTVMGNLITNNTVGIADYGCAPYIANNTIAGNTNGFSFTSWTSYRDAKPDGIIYNNIYDNTHNVMVDSQLSETVDMTNNWWGTTDSSVIAQSIVDENNNLNGKINYVPFLSQPNPQAIPSPSLLTPAPTPNSTPQPTKEPNATIDYSNSFNVESNSTVSAFSFNSSIPEISFTVNGTTGTTGYVKATISKSFMPNGDEIKVYLDNSQIDCTVTSDGDAWIIMFTYHHSSHQVKISQAQNSSPPLVYTEYLPYIAAGVIAALLGFLGLIVWLARVKHSEQ
ncbi:MAG: hypothetical protein ACQCN6_09420 [Candidatus Bathyarchaeia archaeon]|jgi:hypothetical protein